MEWVGGEDVEVASGENQNIEQLGEQRDSLGGSIVVDGPNQDELAGGMGDVGERMEEVERGPDWRHGEVRASRDAQ